MCPVVLPGYDTTYASIIIEQLAQHFDAHWCAIGLLDLYNDVLQEHLLPNGCLCLIPLGLKEFMVVWQLSECMYRLSLFAATSTTSCWSIATVTELLAF